MLEFMLPCPVLEIILRKNAFLNAKPTVTQRHEDELIFDKSMIREGHLFRLYIVK